MMKQRKKRYEVSNENERTTYDVGSFETLARSLHCGDLDKQGAPYFLHLQTVAQRVSEQGWPWPMVSAPHGFTTPWKTGRSPMGTLHRLVPAEVANLVEVLTHRPDETYRNYILRVAAVPAAIPIKIADIEHNLDEKSRGKLADPGGRRRTRYHAALGLLQAASRKRTDGATT